MRFTTTKDRRVLNAVVGIESTRAIERKESTGITTEEEEEMDEDARETETETEEEDAEDGAGRTKTTTTTTTTITEVDRSLAFPRSWKGIAKRNDEVSIKTTSKAEEEDDNTGERTKGPRKID